MIWKILEIEETKDEEVIKQAYREKLRFVNPEDDQEGFMELRQAYEEALAFANRTETEEDAVDEEPEFKGKKNDVDLWIDKVDVIYQDVKTRIDELKWKELLKDSVCDNLDTELEAGEKLLAYFMSHANMPQNIWQVVDKRFGYMENMEQLKEKFPENYLEYVKWQIKKPGFIDYNLFDGKTDKDVDAYINKLYEAKAASEDKDVPHLKQLIKELQRFDVTHPFTETEEARCMMIEAQLLEADLQEGAQLTEVEEQKKQQLLRGALSIMEDLDFQYSDNPYIERIYAETLVANGKIDQARAIYDALMEKDELNYMAMLGKANCTFLDGNPEDAKEQIEDVLEDRVQDVDALNLLETVNKVLVQQYEEQVKESLDPDICYKLGWCYYQQRRSEDGIHLLDQLEEVDDYEYVNLRCRLYLANNDYEKAEPLAQKWLELIEASEDDGSKEMKKRKNRLSLAHFSLGMCTWENEFKGADEQNRDALASRIVRYLETAIEEETNHMVKFSYMEQLARFYLEAKRYTECIAQCDAILEKDRGFFPAYVHRQKAHHELRNAKEVIDDYFACIELYPAYGPPYVLAAEVFYAFDQYDDVEQVIDAAKDAGIESDALELYRIRCLHYKQFSRENTQKALDLLVELRDKVRARKEGETDIEDMSDLEREYAVLHWDLDNTNVTLSIIDEYMKKNPDNTSMLHLKADVLVREGRPHDALEICKRLVELEPDNLHTRTRLGNCYERLDEVSQAIQCYKEILDENPEFVPALRRMMYVYSYLSNENNSLDQCATAVEYATEYIRLTESSEGYLERGNLYIDLYELEKAVEDCKKAIELDEEAYYAYNNLGCALLKLRRVEEAIVPLEQAIALDPDRDHLPYLNLAECLVLVGEYDKAVKMYHEVMRIRPKATRVWRDIAVVYTKAKQYIKAIEVYEKMLADEREAQGKPSFIDKLKKKKEGTLTDADKRIQRLYCDIADVYRQMGDIKKTEEYYDKILSKRSGMKISADAAGKIAEYYRDMGDLKRASELLRYMENHVAQEDFRTQDMEHLDFVRTTVFFELGDVVNTKRCSEQFMIAFLKRHDGEEAVLRDERYRRMYQYVFVVMYACAGHLEKAKKYLNEMQPCKLCVTCTSSDCYEFYFAHGLIAELEGRIEDAIAHYKKAIEVKGDYPCAKRHLEKLL